MTINEQINNNMATHNSNLSKYACNDLDAIRMNLIDNDFRTPFFRDIDKILYTLSYVRYIDKTQVFSFENDDMISKRMTHIQLVSKIARTIGRGLSLNEDLIEAASLGHDLGHVPFGHVGEKILNKLSLGHNEGFFNHNVQSVRILMELENKGYGNNITVQVLDAILCHNGETLKKEYCPIKKSIKQFQAEYINSYKNKEVLAKIQPMTLEGCVVRISDVVAYIGKDIEDAIRLKKITATDVPIKIVRKMGITNSEIVNTIVVDIIKNSINENCIRLSDEIFSLLQELIEFNYKYIYQHANTKEQLKEIENMFEKLFSLYYKQIENNQIEEDIYTVFLNDMSEDYLNKNTTARKVIDYIAGMTDTYFMKQYKKYFE